jgi:hypothetical protein
LTFSKAGYFETPGDYSYGERLQESDGSVRVRQVIGRLTAYATISVEVLDPGGSAAPGTRVRLIALGGQAAAKVETAGADGRFQTQVTPGGYLVCAEPGSRKATAACYPSATDYASATVVIIHPGEAAGPFNIRMIKDPPRYTIRGQIKSLITKTATWGEAVVATPIPPDEPGPGQTGPEHECVNRDGSFLIEGLRAGRYVLRASAGPEVRRNDCSPPKERAAMPFGQVFDDEPFQRPRPVVPIYGNSQTITVSRNIKGLVLKIGRDAIVTGRVVVEYEGARAPAMQGLTLRPWDIMDWNVAGPHSIKLDTDGRFQNSEVEPGSYRVAPAAEAPWYVSKVVQDGKTSADGRVVLKTGGSTALEITYRKATAMLRVDLLRDPAMPADQPVQVTLVPDEPAFRLQGGGFRLGALVTSDHSNQATLGPFPPGSYLVLATHSDPNLRGLEAFRWRRMKDRAVRVELHEGSTETIQVKPLAVETGR